MFDRYALDQIGKINPDIIFTQLSGALEVIERAHTLNIPVYLFMHGYDENLLLQELKNILEQKNI